jgi:integrase
MVARIALRNHKKRGLVEGVKSSIWVSCDKEGRPLRGTHVGRDSLFKVLKEANLPKIRFHDLRHTAATLMLLKGVPIITVKQDPGPFERGIYFADLRSRSAVDGERSGQEDG